MMDSMKEFQKIAICKELELDYNLIDGDVYDGDVFFYKRYDPTILIKFSQLEIRTVEGSFDCSYNELTSLKGCPEIITRSFDCSYNELTSLKGCPEKANGHFDCGCNNLTSLKHGPKKVDGNYWCDINEKKFERPTDCAIEGGFHR